VLAESERKRVKDKQVQGARREKKQRAKEAKGDELEGNKLPQLAPPNTASLQKGGASKEYASCVVEPMKNQPHAFCSQFNLELSVESYRHLYTCRAKKSKGKKKSK